MFYSKSTGGFYVTDIHGSAIPSDAVEISQEDYDALMQGQAEGKVIASTADGRPELVAPAVDVAALIAARRYQAETAGIVVNGTHVPTDRDSQALVTGAALAAVIGTAYTCQWKTAEGFVTLDATSIIAMATAMRAHVQACFDREASLLAELKDGAYTDEQLEQGWPA
ncbi:DUF4376 domain-containing protein [Pseudomonas citronellolis]|uniref:DUF4376 domain-containing protein n=1 Tax=Pseudomonas citronellolis TaxID=53408 RepID=UPI0023E41D5E|nr:DUF4376 domain-containing protein [Pseudomonas citronellolis]MDF3936647.1 DUF4376 domain-containing protein [Pseudomonas citronellolis]